MATRPPRRGAMLDAPPEPPSSSSTPPALAHPATQRQGCGYSTEPGRTQRQRRQQSALHTQPLRPCERVGAGQRGRQRQTQRHPLPSFPAQSQSHSRSCACPHRHPHSRPLSPTPRQSHEPLSSSMGDTATPSSSSSSPLSPTSSRRGHLWQRSSHRRRRDPVTPHRLLPPNFFTIGMLPLLVVLVLAMAGTPARAQLYPNIEFDWNLESDSPQLNFFPSAVSNPDVWNVTYDHYADNDTVGYGSSYYYANATTGPQLTFNFPMTGFAVYGTAEGLNYSDGMIPLGMIVDSRNTQNMTPNGNVLASADSLLWGYHKIQLTLYTGNWTIHKVVVSTGITAQANQLSNVYQQEMPFVDIYNATNPFYQYYGDWQVQQIILDDGSGVNGTDAYNGTETDDGTGYDNGTDTDGDADPPAAVENATTHLATRSVDENVPNGVYSMIYGWNASYIVVNIPANTTFVVLNGAVGPYSTNFYLEWSNLPPIGENDFTFTAYNPYTSPAEMFAYPLDPTVIYQLNITTDSEYLSDSDRTGLALHSMIFYSGAEPLAESNNSRRNKIIAGVVGGVGGLIVLGAALFFLTRWWRRRGKVDEEDEGKEREASPVASEVRFHVDHTPPDNSPYAGEPRAPPTMGGYVNGANGDAVNGMNGANSHNGFVGMNGLNGTMPPPLPPRHPPRLTVDTLGVGAAQGGARDLLSPNSASPTTHTAYGTAYTNPSPTVLTAGGYSPHHSPVHTTHVDGLSPTHVTHMPAESPSGDGRAARPVLPRLHVTGLGPDPFTDANGEVSSSAVLAAAEATKRSPLSARNSRPAWRPPPRAVQEEDGGAVPEPIELVPPIYNPEWARDRAQREREPDTATTMDTTAGFRTLGTGNVGQPHSPHSPHDMADANDDLGPGTGTLAAPDALEMLGVPVPDTPEAQPTIDAAAPRPGHSPSVHTHSTADTHEHPGSNSSAPVSPISPVSYVSAAASPASPVSPITPVRERGDV